MRLIDADELVRIFSIYDTVTTGYVRQIIQTRSEAVTRCKDCKYRDDTGTCGMRPWLFLPVKDDGFCSEGERREDE